MCDKGQRQAKGVKGGRKKAKKRAKEERMQEKIVKEAEGERKQQRKMVALETARPHQNLRSDADGHDEQRYYPT